MKWQQYAVFISAPASAHANVNRYSRLAMLSDAYESRCTLTSDNLLLRVYVGVSYNFRFNHIYGFYFMVNLVNSNLFRSTFSLWSANVTDVLASFSQRKRNDLKHPLQTFNMVTSFP